MQSGVGLPALRLPVRHDGRPGCGASPDRSAGCPARRPDAAAAPGPKSTQNSTANPISHWAAAILGNHSDEGLGK